MNFVRIAGIEPESIVDGAGIRYTIFMQGCLTRCEDCHNKKTWDVSGGTLMPIEKILEDITNCQNQIDGITLSGGEPFLQPRTCSTIAQKCKELGLSVWCYTGYRFEDLCCSQSAEALQHIDVLVDGEFQNDQKSLDLQFRGSKNQRMIDVQESLKESKVVLFDLK